MTGPLLVSAFAGSPALPYEGSADPGRPFVTFYGDGTGERVELSLTTLDNWVAKTAGLVVDGLGLGPGDRLRLDVPRHWQLPVWALAAWTTGLLLDLDGDPALSQLAVSGPDGLAAAGAAAEVIGLSLRPLGAPFAPGTLPAGVLDYAREVGGYSDHFPGRRLDPAAPVLTCAGTTWSLAEAVAEAARLASGWGLDAGGRLLVSEPLDPVSELLAVTLVPLGLGGSVVLSAVEVPAERTTAEARGNLGGGPGRP